MVTLSSFSRVLEEDFEYCWIMKSKEYKERSFTVSRLRLKIVE